MGERLREIAQQAAGNRVVFFRQQADIIAYAEQVLKYLPRFGMPPLQGKIVRKPEGADQKSTFPRRKAVDFSKGAASIESAPRSGGRNRRR